MHCRIIYYIGSARTRSITCIKYFMTRRPFYPSVPRNAMPSVVYKCRSNHSTRMISVPYYRCAERRGAEDVDKRLPPWSFDPSVDGREIRVIRSIGSYCPPKPGAKTIFPSSQAVPAATSWKTTRPQLQRPNWLDPLQMRAPLGAHTVPLGCATPLAVG